MVENGREGLTSKQVSEVIVTAQTVSRPEMKCEVVKGRLVNATLPSLSPKRVLDHLIGRQLGLLPVQV